MSLHGLPSFSIGLRIRIGESTHFGFETTESTSIIFITGDGDFAHAICNLRNIGHDVYVISPGECAHSNLKSAASGLLPWECVVPRKPKAIGQDIRPNVSNNGVSNNGLSSTSSGPKHPGFTLQHSNPDSSHSQQSVASGSSSSSATLASTSTYLPGPSQTASTQNAIHKALLPLRESQSSGMKQADIPIDFHIPTPAITKPAAGPASTNTPHLRSSSGFNIQATADAAGTKGDPSTAPPQRQYDFLKLIGILQDLRNKGEKCMKSRRLRDIIRDGGAVTKKKANEYIDMARKIKVIRQNKTNELELHPNFC